MEADDDGVTGEVNPPPQQIDRHSQLTTQTSVRSMHSTSPVPPDVSDILAAKEAIHQSGQHPHEPEEPSLQLEDLRRPEQKGSQATATTANSSWSQLPIAQPIDVVAQESSMSLLPNSGVVPFSESQIDRGEISSIRDHLTRRASDRTNSSNMKSVGQLTDTFSLTETSSSGYTSSMQQTPRPHRLETTDELEADADEEEGYDSVAKQKKKEEPSGISNMTLGIIAALVVLIVAIVAGVCLSGQCGGGSDTDNSPTMSPTIFVDRRTRIAEYIQSITESEFPIVYPVPQSREPTNQEKALHWLVDQDPLELQGFADELNRVRNRFVLTSIWFLTAPKSYWKDTTNWLSGAHECEWANVLCDESEGGERRIAQVAVQGIELGDENIVGVIPEDLALLSDGLVHLQLAINGLTGTIPTFLGMLTKLTFLDLQGNSLSGPIPTELGNLTSLQTLRLGDNSFEGTLPIELGSLTNLRVLNLFANRISGPVPSSFGNLSSIRFLWVQDTLLSGTLPPSLAGWQDTNEIFLFNTRINGTIPFCEAEDPSFFQLVADCGEVECNCCTACCPRPSGSIPVYTAC